MGGYLTYTEYKDSGINWFEKIPTHWEQKRLKFIAKKVQTGTTPPTNKDSYYEEGTLNWFAPGDFEDNQIFLEESKKKLNQVVLDEGIVKIIPKGSVLIVGIGATLGKVGLLKIDAISNQQINAVLLDENVAACFITYQLSILQEAMRVISNSTTLGIMNQEKTKQIPLIIPPLEEQRSIARFLDYKTAQIDALIAKKEALLEKLAEKRTALISQAVTKGCDRTVPMKDSGVEWLGEIPAHWEIKRQRFLMTMSGGSTPSTSNPDFWDGDIPWITPKDMKRERLVSSIDKLSQEALDKTSIQLHSSGRVLIVVRGMILAHTFPVAVNTVPVTVNQDMKVMGTCLNPEYLAVLLRGITNLVLSIVEESAHGTKVLRTDLFRNIWIPVPSKKEQEQIVQHVEQLTNDSDRMTGYVQHAIARLKEYRTALITNAVTGKIDVRDVKLPELDPMEAA